MFKELSCCDEGILMKTFICLRNPTLTSPLNKNQLRNTTLCLEVRTFDPCVDQPSIERRGPNVAGGVHREKQIAQQIAPGGLRVKAVSVGFWAQRRLLWAVFPAVGIPLRFGNAAEQWGSGQLAELNWRAEIASADLWNLSTIPPNTYSSIQVVENNRWLERFSPWTGRLLCFSLCGKMRRLNLQGVDTGKLDFCSASFWFASTFYAKT